jgi:hypothetical protein
MLGDFAAWDGLFAKYSRLAGQLRQPRWEYWLDLLRSFRAFLAADLKTAEQFLQRAEHIAEGFGWAREGLYGVAMFLIRREQGRLSDLAPIVKASSRLNPVNSVWRPGLAALYTEMGWLDDARREFEAVVSKGFAGLSTDGSRELSLGLLAEVCVALGDNERAHWILQQLRPCEGRFLTFFGCPAGLGPTDRILGMLASTLDLPEDADQWHRTGLDLARGLDSPLWIAHCLYDYAVHLLPRHTSEARRMLHEVGAICGKHGLVSLGGRVKRVDRSSERQAR